MTPLAEPTIDFDTGLRAFGFDTFRPGQREALEALVRHRRLLLVAPTGGGKSLIYQLPATMLPGTTLVISPLISLMHDQVEALGARGIPATYLASTLPDHEVMDRLRRLRAGEYRLVYVAPERLPSPGFRDLIQKLGCPLVAVDEAHCISQWGHDFRPEYRQIQEFLGSVRGAMVLACTATATPVVRDDIVRQLGTGPDTPQIVRGFARPNLALRARPVESAAELDGAVDEALRAALGGPSAGDAAAGGGAAAGAGGAIIYCLTRKDAEEQAKRLRRDGWRSGWYHAGLAGEHRGEVQDRFMRGELQVVAATNAFGMGIDRSDVRAVIHTAPPDSIEAYYQEVGRAGRDGLDASGLLLLRTSDIPRRRALLERSARESGTTPEFFEHKWSMYLDLIRWGEGGSCRHDSILRYFGDEAETLHGCGRCDVCLALSESADGPGSEGSERIVGAVLRAVALVHERLGMKATVKFLRGEKDDRLDRAGLPARPGYGALADESEIWVGRVLQRCVTAGWVDFTSGEYKLLSLTDTGRAVLEGKRLARLVLPTREAAGSAGAKSRRVRTVSRGASGWRSAESGRNQAGSEWDERLFQTLREWRRVQCQAEAIPAFAVATDRSLQDIATVKPGTLAELRLCHGIGPHKAEKYGPAIVAIVKKGAG
ncbi:MAG TPA: RecQ family ATP-dependent DNA helicase [Candidatus Limnocylindrales bacterium]|nr:RecQ family ATP-dependent DNA helicase [Candidatus Limnocylindrales bacterium]